MSNKIIVSKQNNPCFNLALEEYLFEKNKGDIIFYLWQNKNTVVIGRTQNAYNECKINQLQDDNGKLVRRTTGGGAVYHDMGNLNFSFICPENEYSLKRQLGLILEVVKSYNIDAEFSGRNDLLTQGKKFSGNAFKITKEKCLHHGTILIDTNAEKLGKYLNPSFNKMKSKGIKSVKSRIINLIELNKDIKVQEFIERLQKAFINEYGKAETIEDLSNIKNDEYFIKLLDKHNSWEWIYGENPQFDTQITKVYSFGEFKYLFDVKNGNIQDLKIYSDTLNCDFLFELEKALKGIKYNTNSVLENTKQLNVFNEYKEFTETVKDIII